MSFNSFLFEIHVLENWVLLDRFWFCWEKLIWLLWWWIIYMKMFITCSYWYWVIDFGWFVQYWRWIDDQNCFRSENLWGVCWICEFVASIPRTVVRFFAEIISICFSYVLGVYNYWNHLKVCLDNFLWNFEVTLSMLWWTLFMMQLWINIWTLSRFYFDLNFYMRSFTILRLINHRNHLIWIYKLFSMSFWKLLPKLS
jgi:hypothetical protein